MRVIKFVHCRLSNTVQSNRTKASNSANNSLAWLWAGCVCLVWPTLEIQDWFLPSLLPSFLSVFFCSSWKCSKCDLRENLWLNLTDGSVLCGKWFFDGSGGNGHAMEHYKETGYPLAVKLGTITPDGAGQPPGRFWDGVSFVHETDGVYLLPSGFVLLVQMSESVVWKEKPVSLWIFIGVGGNGTHSIQRKPFPFLSAFLPLFYIWCKYFFWGGYIIVDL